MSEDYSDGYIYVDYSHMNNAADDLRQQTNAIAKTISSMEMELTQLKKTWAGDDAETYEKKQATWDHAVQAMQDMLNSHSQLLEDIHNSYRHNENNLSQMWSEVRIGG